MIPAEYITAARNIDIVATAQRFTTLKRSGAEYIGPCPVCGGKDRFGVNTKKQVWHCRVCGKGGNVIALVEHATGASFAAAVAELAGELGAHHDNVIRRPPPPPPDPAPDNGRIALDIWQSARPLRGTLGETYPRRRRIDLDQIPDLDDVLRFAPRCLFGNERLPCVIALVRDIVTNEPVAIQRTAIDSSGKKIGRLSLGPTKGGAIKLWADAAVSISLVVGEGMETVASAATAIHYEGTVLQPAWSLLDRGNLGTFPVLPGIEVLTILVDNDESGHGQADAATCARRWREAGRKVYPLIPRKRGSDFNDIIVRGEA
jgi:hypothetical protein